MRLVFVLVFFAYNLVVLGCEDWLMPFGEDDQSQEQDRRTIMEGLGMEYVETLYPEPFDARAYLSAFSTQVLQSFDAEKRAQVEQAIFDPQSGGELLLAVHEFNPAIERKFQEHPLLGALPGLRLFSRAYNVQSAITWEARHILRYSYSGNLGGYSPRVEKVFVVGKYYLHCVYEAVDSIVKAFLKDPEWQDLELVFVQDLITLIRENESFVRTGREILANRRRDYHHKTLKKAFGRNFFNWSDDPSTYIYRDPKNNKTIKFVYSFSEDLL